MSNSPFIALATYEDIPSTAKQQFPIQDYNCITVSEVTFTNKNLQIHPKNYIL